MLSRQVEKRNPRRSSQNRLPLLQDALAKPGLVLITGEGREAALSDLLQSIRASGAVAAYISSDDPGLLPDLFRSRMQAEVDVIGLNGIADDISAREACAAVGRGGTILATIDAGPFEASHRLAALMSEHRATAALGLTLIIHAGSRSMSTFHSGSLDLIQITDAVRESMLSG